MFSQVTNYLDAHSGSIAALATVVLVVITYFYAKTTRQLLQEQKHDRRRKSLPRLRVFEMERTPKTIPLAAATVIKEMDFYRVRLKNVGEGLAYLVGVRMWDGRASADRDQEIDMLPASFKEILFPGEEDVLAYYDNVPNGTGSRPTKVQIWYRDEFGSLITYTARRMPQITVPTPYLGLKDYIAHKYEGPEQKVAEYVPKWKSADKKSHQDESDDTNETR